MSTPLLVDCLNITTWLENRKKLHKDWYQYLKAAEEKIKLLTKDHQQYAGYPDLKQYLMLNQDTFHSVDVNIFVQKLLKTPLADDKSLVFGYSDKRVKEWTNLQKYMKSKLVGLLSSAKFIKQTLSFDLPGLDKNIELLQNQLSNLKRKIDFNTNTIFQQNRDRQKQQKELGIDGSKIEDQIQKLIRQIPSMFKDFHNVLVQTETARLIQKYQRVCLQNGAQNSDKYLFDLKKFIENGDQVLQKIEGMDVDEQSLGKYKYKQFYDWVAKNEWQIQIQGASAQKSQTMPYQRTILSERKTRQQIIYDMNQLLYFFKGIKVEKSTGDYNDPDTQLSDFSSADADKAIQNVNRALGFLTSQKLTTALQLKSNRKSYQLLVKKFMNYRKNIEHMNSQIRSYQQQIEKLNKDRQKLVQKLRYLRGKAVQAKKQCEICLTDLVKREVRITGQVNKLQ